jgi:uncharacterized protein (TIGR03067 family)
MTRAILIFSFLSCFSFFVLFFSCTKGNPAAPAATTELEGSWSGYLVDAPDVSVGLRIQRNGIIYTFGGQELYQATFTLDKSQTPNHLDAVITSSRNTQYVGKSSVGIYQLIQDTLLIAGNEPGNSLRPTSFTPSGKIAVMRVTR